MDFLPHMVSNDRTNVFINKAKKQAKRLYKLSQKNDNQLNIDNLAQAQDILAQLNGYENWHAMIQSIQTAEIKNNPPTVPYEYVVTAKNEKFALTKDQCNENTIYSSTTYPYLKENDYIYSFLDIFPIEEAKKNMKAENFCGNMYYLFRVLETYSNSSFELITHYKEVETDLYAWEQQESLATKIGITSEIARKLFMVEYPTKTKNALHSCLVIKTLATQKANHYKNINRLLLDHYCDLQLVVADHISVDTLSVIKNNEIKHFNSKTQYNSRWFKNLFKKPTIEQQNIIELISYLSSINNPPKHLEHLDLNKQSLTIYHSNLDADKIDNAFHNIKSVNTYSYDLRLATKRQNNGIPFINEKNQTACYQYNPLYHNNTAFLGNNKTNYVLHNYIEYIKIIDYYKESNQFYNGYYLYSGRQHPLYDLLISTLDEKLHPYIHCIDINPQIHSINIFDTPLGAKELDDSYSSIADIIFEILFGKDYKTIYSLSENNLRELHSVTYELIKNLYQYIELKPKTYAPYISPEVDKALPKHLKNSTWFDLSVYFIRNNQINLSKICHYNSMPLIEDLLNLLENSYDNYRQIFKGIFNVDIIKSNVKDFIITKPQYNKPTNLILQNHHLYFLNFDMITNLDNSDNFLYNLFIAHIFENRKNYHFNIDDEFKIFYKSKDVNVPLSLSIFNKDTLQENQDYPIIQAVRESKKWNISINFISTYIPDLLMGWTMSQFFTSLESINSLQYNNEKLYNSIKSITDNEFVFYGTYYHDNLPNGKYKIYLNQEILSYLAPDFT